MRTHKPCATKTPTASDATTAQTNRTDDIPNLLIAGAAMWAGTRDALV
jgi:hypothetical protein